MIRLSTGYSFTVAADVSTCATSTRAVQKAYDRQRLLQVHGALLYDDRLPLVATNLRRTEVPR
jgi:hypothetical protein